MLSKIDRVTNLVKNIWGFGKNLAKCRQIGTKPGLKAVGGSLGLKQEAREEEGGKWEGISESGGRRDMKLLRSSSRAHEVRRSKGLKIGKYQVNMREYKTKT